MTNKNSFGLVAGLLIGSEYGCGKDFVGGDYGSTYDPAFVSHHEILGL